MTNAGYRFSLVRICASSFLYISISSRIVQDAVLSDGATADFTSFPSSSVPGGASN